MVDNEEGEATAPKGNEWEVVSLTASAYAAAPSPQQADSAENSQVNLVVEHEAETSSDMFISGHFVFPPSQHENLPVGSEYVEVVSGSEDDVSQLGEEDKGDSDVKNKENVLIERLVSDESCGNQLFYDKSNMLSEEQGIYSTTEFSSLHHEVIMGKSTTVEEGEGTDVSIEQNFQKPVDGDKHDGDDLPCEPWWKRRAVSLYANAKEVNSFWSIFIAAAVMGLVIIGQRWQDSHPKGLCGVNDERVGRLLSPISRFKDVFVDGHQRGSFVQGRASTER